MTDVLKFLFKMVLGLAVGIIAGFLIAGIIIVGLTDTTSAEFISNLTSINLSEMLIAGGVGVLAFIVSMSVLIVLHEAGHLVCGFLSGYKFVSFRIFSFTIIHIDGKLRVRRYSICGTGGQCLLAPPDLPLEKIPTGWYNFGGVFFNLLALLIVAPLFFVKGHPFLTECTFIFALTDIFILLLNGIPMKVAGVGNDAYNMLLLRKNIVAKQALVVSLKANALVQNGVRPKDMPAEWFAVPENIDYRNQLEVSLPIMAAARLVDEMNYVAARNAYEQLYVLKEQIISLYVNEIACELIFLRMMTGDIEGASTLLDKNLKRYIATYRKVMSSKERILCAIALNLDHNRDKAVSIYESVKNRKKDYLLQGEVRSDLEIMHEMLMP